MGTKTLRIIGITFLALALVMPLADVWRGGVNFLTFLLPALWVVIGLGCILRARNRRL